MESLKQIWRKFGLLIVLGCGGLIPAQYLLTPDLAVIMKVSSIISLFLIITSLALDDRQGKGLFPSYDEDQLIMNANSSPIASALVIFTKNMLMAIILILAVLFVRP
jgi:hypothetical protein